MRDGCHISFSSGHWPASSWSTHIQNFKSIMKVCIQLSKGRQSQKRLCFFCLFLSVIINSKGYLPLQISRRHLQWEAGSLLARSVMNRFTPPL
jgi:hypothetical protein